MLEAEVVEAMVSKTLLAILAGNLLELLGIVAVDNPLLSRILGKPFFKST